MEGEEVFQNRTIIFSFHILSNSLFTLQPFNGWEIDTVCPEYEAMRATQPAWSWWLREM
jgi:hypothetical protein